MVAFIVGNSDPDSPILTTEVIPQGSPPRNAQDAATSEESAAEQPLIPGIPDDMARKCLARVPFWFHGRCKTVSKSWRSMYSDPELLHLRQSEGVREEYLLCFEGNPSVCQGQLYSPDCAKWRKIPPTPVELHSYGLESFGVVATRQHVYLIGGVMFDARSYPTDFPVPSDIVYRYDLVRNKWETVARMGEPRGSVACAVAIESSSTQGSGSGEPEKERVKIYVAGGDGRYAQSQRRWSHLSSAEVYDTSTNEWTPLPPMNSLRAGSSGLVVDNRFAVFGGYGTPRLIAGFLHVCEQCQDSEVYSEQSGKWSRTRLAWFPEDRACTGPVAQIGGDAFMLLGSAILRLQLSCSVWCHEASLDWADRDAAFFALKGELHVVPSEKVSSVYQKQFSYDPVAKKWRTSKIKPRMRYMRNHWACKQPFKSTTLLSL